MVDMRKRARDMEAEHYGAVGLADAAVREAPGRRTQGTSILILTLTYPHFRQMDGGTAINAGAYHPSRAHDAAGDSCRAALWR